MHFQISWVLVQGCFVNPQFVKVPVLLEGKMRCVRRFTARKKGKGRRIGENGTCESLAAANNKKIIKERFEEERKQTHPTENGKRR